MSVPIVFQAFKFLLKKFMLTPRLRITLEKLLHWSPNILDWARIRWVRKIEGRTETLTSSAISEFKKPENFTTRIATLLFKAAGSILINWLEIFCTLVKMKKIRYIMIHYCFFSNLSEGDYQNYQNLIKEMSIEVTDFIKSAVVSVQMR